ncbi:MAG: sulfotransferase [Anaerolineales bacterium]|nr:sulfotransferase [Anaerolineales bacterium]
MVAQVDKHYFRQRPFSAVRRIVTRTFFEGRPITTRGRWLNPLVFAHFAVEKKLPQLKQVKNPIFIIGSGRSGTTILGTIMSIHREVGFLNEPKALWHVVHPQEDVIGHYSLGPAAYRLDAQDATSEMKQTAHKLFGAYLALTLAHRLVDKNPELVFRIPFVRALFPDAKFIFIIRNGWNTCASIENWSKERGVAVNDQQHDWWGVDNRKWQLMIEQIIPHDPDLANVVTEISHLISHTDMAVVEWIVTMREGLMQMKHHADCIHLVKYEEMIANPRQVLPALLRFCDLSNDETFLAYAEHSLRSAPIHPRFEVHSAILPAFEKMLAELGY